MSLTCQEVRKYISSISQVRAMGNPRTPKGWLWPSVEAMVLEHGVDWPLGVLRRSGQVKECYKNAYDAARRDPSLRYVEGWAAGVIPVEHAWVVDPQGQVIETTWRSLGTAYVGVPIKLEVVWQVISSANVYGVLWAWGADFPLMRVPARKWLAPGQPV